MSLKSWAEAQRYKGGALKYLYDVVVGNDTSDATVAGKVTALETTVGDSSSGLVKTVADHTIDIGKASGEGAGGILKDVADLKTAVGSADTDEGSLKKRCKAIETDIGDEDTVGTILYRIKALEDAH